MHILGHSEVLKIWSSDMSREDFEMLASNHEDWADMRIVLHARNATVTVSSLMFCDLTQLS